MNWNLVRRFMRWLQEWPCKHGHHEFGLWRAGSALWWRDCEHCLACEFTFQPKRREDCDIDHYHDVYLKVRAARSA